MGVRRATQEVGVAGLDDDAIRDSCGVMRLWCWAAVPAAVGVDEERSLLERVWEDTCDVGAVDDDDDDDLESSDFFSSLIRAE